MHFSMAAMESLVGKYKRGEITLEEARTLGKALLGEERIIR